MITNIINTIPLIVNLLFKGINNASKIVTINCKVYLIVIFIPYLITIVSMQTSIIEIDNTIKTGSDNNIVSILKL